MRHIGMKEVHKRNYGKKGERTMEKEKCFEVIEDELFRALGEEYGYCPECEVHPLQKFTLEQERRKNMEKNTTQDNQATYKPTHSFYIAGVQHHQMHKVLSKLKNDNYLQLVPEPTNKFDPNAIRIEYYSTHEEVMCGYVPKKFSSEVCAAIEVGKHLKCVITEFVPSAKPWEQCKVEIREVQDA